MALLIEISGFGKWLKTKREAQNLSMRLLSEKAGNVCSPSYIAQLETNYYVSKKGNPMQPSEEIVEKLAIALGESVDEARKAANYPLRDETTEENTRFELSNFLHKYDRLSLKSRQLANRLLNETIDFLLQVESIKFDDIPIKDIEKVVGFEDLREPSEKPEMLTDDEIKRLGIKPLKVGKIKKEAQ